MTTIPSRDGRSATLSVGLIVTISGESPAVAKMHGNREESESERERESWGGDPVKGVKDYTG